MKILKLTSKQKRGITLLKKAFGSLRLKKPTQKVMDEIDEGYD